MKDLYTSGGPVSSMPGSSHPFPEGSMCDDHDDRPAVKRIQGETDSFGCEYFFVCQECLDRYNAERNSVEAKTGKCSWCSMIANDLKNHRDMDEGMAGPVYRVCKACREKEAQRLAEEWESDYEFSDEDIDPNEDD